jgi:hypothetical protein
VEKKLCNEELNDLYSPSIIWVIKLRRMRWEGIWDEWGRGELYTGFWWGNLRERDHLEDSGIYKKIILKWLFRKVDGRHGLNWSGSEQGQVTGSCKCGNEHSGSIKCREFLD